MAYLFLMLIELHRQHFRIVYVWTQQHELKPHHLFKRLGACMSVAAVVNIERWHTRVCPLDIIPLSYQ